MYKSTELGLHIFADAAFFQDLQSKKGRLHSVNLYEFGPHPWLDDRFAQSATHKEHFGSM